MIRFVRWCIWLFAFACLLVCAVTSTVFVRSFYVGNDYLWETREASNGILYQSSLEVQIGKGGIQAFLRTDTDSPYGVFFGDFEPPKPHPDEARTLTYIPTENSPFYPEGDFGEGPGRWTGWGFQFMRDVVERTGGSGHAIHSVTVPLICVIAVFGLPSAVLAWSIWRRRHRYKAGHCAACGYDLRATPHRCPECGTTRAIEECQQCKDSSPLASS